MVMSAALVWFILNKKDIGAKDVKTNTKIKKMVSFFIRICKLVVSG